MIYLLLIVNIALGVILYDALRRDIVNARCEIADIRVQIAELHKDTEDLHLAIVHQIADLRELLESTHTSTDSELSAYELERLEREEAFDSRIAQIKEELARTQDFVKRGVTADELHPLVHNLPHNIIDNRVDDLPDVEIAD